MQVDRNDWLDVFMAGTVKWLMITICLTCAALLWFQVDRWPL